MNRVGSLSRTISYLENANPRPDEVIVVDQTQDHEIAVKIEEICKKTPLNAEYKWNSEPSLTKARNSGYALANGDIIVFMDDDVDVKKDTFANIHQIFSNNTIGLAGGINEYDDLSQFSMKSVILGKKSYRKRKIGHVTKSVYGRFPISCNESTDTEWAMGFFFAVRKSLLEKWNLRFDENLSYYAYAEDLDFTYSFFLHARIERIKCILSTKLKVCHNVSQEYRIPKRNETFMYILHRRYIRNKLIPGYMSVLLCWISELGDFVYRYIHKENPMDILKAHLFYFKYKKDILNGNFHYEEFM